MNKFDRILNIGKGDSRTWIKKIEEIFEPGIVDLVTEQELRVKIGKLLASGSGDPVVLIRPQLKTGIITVYTKPVKNSAILLSRLDGSCGRTAVNGEMTPMPIGQCRIKAVAEGFEQVEEIVSISADDDKTVTLTLTPKIGIVTIKAKYDGEDIDANVILSSENTTLEGDISWPYELEYGQWYLRVKAEGFFPAQKTIDINEHKKQTIVFNLERAPNPMGNVVINTSPPDATFIMTSLDGLDNRTAKNGDLLEVPVGEWLLKVEADGYIPKENAVIIKEGKVQIFNLN